MISPAGLEEYAFTIGILIAFLGTIFFAVRGRKDIISVCRSAGIKKNHLLIGVALVVLFLAVELSLVMPTQLLFFDDVIYQSMSLHLINLGQAWMCNYGTPTMCYIGQIFHEPIGTSFDIAIGFLIFGVSRNVGYAVGVAMAAVSVFLTYLVAFLLFRDFKSAAFSGLLMALSPIVLVWAMPTNSDMHFLAYSLVAVFFLLVFREKENVNTFGTLALSLALVSYMKIIAMLLVPVAIIMYMALEKERHSGVIRRTYAKIRKNIGKTAVLAILLLAFISLTISVVYAYTQNTPGNFGEQGSPVQNSCDNLMQTITSESDFGIQLFEFNVCGNLLFWLDTYQSQYIMQPVFFTALMLVGGTVLAFRRKWALLAIAIWLLSFFLVYTAFYAGDVLYGVDWRFMLSTIAQASILGGFCCSMAISTAGSLPKKFLRKKELKKMKSFPSGIRLGVAIVLVGLIAGSVYLLVPYLAVNPSQIPQAGDARFYEGMVYNSSSVIPKSCIVFSYDPTLFFLNNRSAAQMYFLYNSTFIQQASSQYSCMVLDYGYWCYTPNNDCEGVNQSYNLSPLYLSTYKPLNRTYGFYYITPKANDTQ